MPLRYSTRADLDEAKWNACIDAAGNGAVYAYSFYLDAMADNWDALVLDDYAAVMPLTWRRKWGVHYLYQPPFCAQLGVFGADMNEALVQQFLAAVPSKFRYWDFYGNRQNMVPSGSFAVRPRVNYVLPLQQTYALLEKNYRDNIRRNIRKWAKLAGSAAERVDLAEVVALANMQPQQAATSEKDYARLARLHGLLASRGAAKTYGLRLANGALVASAVFFFSHRRAYYILVGNHPNGRTLGASHALIDAFIRDHAGSDLTLDFEGSDIRNLSFFYSSFGATQEHYPAFLRNDLPFWMKWLKR